ncbi:MAG: D-alanine glycine permease [Flavobacteriaceae bacterium]|nr:MAG: D-alanine glycine permease [Flavobacteriaceae bacterium]
MKKTILSSLLLLSQFALAQEKTLSEKIDSVFKDNTTWFVESMNSPIHFPGGVEVPWVLVVLVTAACFFTLYFGFINFRGFGLAVDIVRGKYDDLENKGSEGTSGNGEVSHFQALATALSATVGLGNIAGVAIAISIGGPGATFWMIIAGLLGMTTKFVECTLGLKYRDIDADGTVHGGAMYYLTKGFAKKGDFLGVIGKILAVFFAIFCVGGSFGIGSMFQANQAFKAFEGITGGENSFIFGKGLYFGIAVSILVGVVIIGGIKSIARVTDKLVPFMVGTYCLAGLFILFANYQAIPQAFCQIFSGAFHAEGIAGGVIGAMISGFKRAAFSNEAGIGSAPIAHSAAKTNYAASEGLVALLEPFIDTVVICTMTALVIVVSNVDGSVMQYGQKVSEGVLATSVAFKETLSFFPYILSLVVMMFAISTMISWSYYGLQAWTYLFSKSKFSEYLYKIIFCITIWIGSAASLNAVIDFTDAMIFAMMVPNIIGLVVLLPEVKEELNRYLQAIKK